MRSRPSVREHVQEFPHSVPVLRGVPQAAIAIDAIAVASPGLGDRNIARVNEIAQVGLRRTFCDADGNSHVAHACLRMLREIDQYVTVIREERPRLFIGSYVAFGHGALPFSLRRFPLPEY